MSSPEKRTPTRRSTRSVSKSPLKARLEEAAASPLPSHPIRPEPSPPEEAKPRRTPRRSTRAAKREASDSEGEQPAAAGKGAGAGKGAPAASAGGASPLLLLLAVLAVGAAVIFARFNGYLDLPPKPYRAASTADGDSPRGKQRRPSLLDFEPIPQPVPPSPPLPPITPEEIAAFEQVGRAVGGLAGCGKGLLLQASLLEMAAGARTPRLHCRRSAAHCCRPPPPPAPAGG